MPDYKGQVENTYVELIDPVGNANTDGETTVKLHAQMTDASGETVPATPDFDKWGFFYEKTTTPDFAPDSGDESEDADGTPTANDGDWFSTTALNVKFGRKYYFNAYLKDSDVVDPPEGGPLQTPTGYIFQNNGANDDSVADVGTSFIIPNVDHTVPASAPFQVTLTGHLEYDNSGGAVAGAQPFSDAFPFVDAGFEYREDGGAWIDVGSADWTPGTMTWTKTIPNLKNNQAYESKSWIKVKNYTDAAAALGSAPPASAPQTTLKIDCWEPENNSWSTTNHEVPDITDNFFESKHVQVVFYPDEYTTSSQFGTATQRYVHERNPLKPIEVYFNSKLFKYGAVVPGYSPPNNSTETTEVGFFVSKESTTTTPDSTSHDHLIAATLVAEQSDEEFMNNVTGEASAIDDFPIPGQPYRVNAYAKAENHPNGAKYYYWGAEATWPPEGVIFQTPRVIEPDATPEEAVQITTAGDNDGDGEATFNAEITHTISYPGFPDGSVHRKGFFYWSAVGADAAGGAGPGASPLYPGFSTGSTPGGGGSSEDNPDDGPVRVQEEWDDNATPGAFSNTNDGDHGLKWGLRYWVRPFVSYNQGGTGLSTIYYGTKNVDPETNLDAQHWENGREFYIPKVGVTPDGEGSQTDSTFALSSMDLVETDHGDPAVTDSGKYNGKPPIKEKGYYVRMLNSNFVSGDRRATTPGSTKTWGAVIIGDGGSGGTALTASKTYFYQAYALVYQDQTGSGATFEVLSSEIRSITTTTPLSVLNSVDSDSDDEGFIEVGPGSSGGGLSGPDGGGQGFRNITVTGYITSAPLDQPHEVGFFIGHHPPTADKKPNYNSYDGHFLNAAPPASAGQHVLNTNNNALGDYDESTPLDLGKTYYVNFYASTKDTPLAGVDDYVYADDPAPTGVKFQIPKVENRNTKFFSEDKIELRGTVECTGELSVPSPMTPVSYGFVLTTTVPPGGNDVSPHVGTGGGGTDITWTSETNWANLVNDFETEVEPTAGSPPNSDPWNTFVRGTNYYINAFVKDNNDIHYYPLGGEHIFFTLPDPVITASPSGITYDEVTLHGKIHTTTITKPGIKQFGFRYSETPGITVGGGSKESATGSHNGFSKTITGLDANKDYYYRVYVWVYEVGTGGSYFEMISPTPEGTFSTPPDFGIVENRDPQFRNGGIKLRGHVVRVGEAGAGGATKMGFFISKSDTSPGVESGPYTDPPNPPPDTDTWQLAAAVSVGDFEYNLDFSVFPPGTVTAHAGDTYYINAWVNQPTVSVPPLSPNTGYRYHTGTDLPGTGKHITLPNLVAAVITPPLTLDSITPPPPAETVSFGAKLYGNLVTKPKINGLSVVSAKKGFFVDTAANPDPGDEEVFTSDDEGEWNDVVGSRNLNTDYYFNSYVFDGYNYYYIGTTDDVNVVAPTGFQFKLPGVTSEVTLVDSVPDISGDAVQISASNTDLTSFEIDKIGLYLKPPGESEEEIYYEVPPSPGGSNDWNTSYGKPLDIFDGTLGGNKTYNITPFVEIDTVRIRGAEVTFVTPEWPEFRYIDISRNVDVGANEGYIKMKSQIDNYGVANAEIFGSNENSHIGYYIGIDPKPRTGSFTQSVFEPIDDGGVPPPYINIRESKDTGYLDRGTLYYTNVAVSQDAWHIGSTVDPSNTQYYGIAPGGPPSCTTFARGKEGNFTNTSAFTFPDGISFIIPKIENTAVEIIDSSTAILNLVIDSSGHTVDVPGTDILGFFLSDDEAQCRKNGTQSSGTFDASNIRIPEVGKWDLVADRIPGPYSLDASGLIAGKNWYYSGYTALTAGPERGEGVDQDNYWYPPGYTAANSTNSVIRFCIGKSSCSGVTSKTKDTTTLQGETVGEKPFPDGGEYGFTYWFDGSNNGVLNPVIGNSNPAPTGSWPLITLTNLHDSTRYYALPYFKQTENYIYGDQVGNLATNVEYKYIPTVWYTDLALCEVSLNGIEAVVFGNDNGGSSDGEGTGPLSGDGFGSQTRYKLTGIDASLNLNPPNNFDVEDCSGTVQELGLCWKETDDPLGVGKATVSDFHKNLLYDGSYNGWQDVSEAGDEDVLVDASYNIYDASINDLLYNTMYSLRTYAKNVPVIDISLPVALRQSGSTEWVTANGYAYSEDLSLMDGWFITPLPKVLMEDPSSVFVEEIDDVIPSPADKVFTKMGLSGEILDNPADKANIIEYGFLWKMFEPEGVPGPVPDYTDSNFSLEECDASFAFLSPAFNEDIPYKFDKKLSLHPGVSHSLPRPYPDLSYNRHYYLGSYAKNMSDYVTNDLVEADPTGPGRPEMDGVLSYAKVDLSFNTPWPIPFIQIKELKKPANLTTASEFSFARVSLEIFNYDPTKWGGIVEFGVIWETTKNLRDHNTSETDFTMQWMDLSGAWVDGTDGSGGWYRRGCSGEDPESFKEEEGEDRPTPHLSGPDGWWWDRDGTPIAQGWQFDASFASGGIGIQFDEESENKCRFPLDLLKYIKLGAYDLGGVGSDYPCAASLVDHKPPPEGTGSVQDPSNIPFNQTFSYWLRPYIITKNIGFWEPPEEDGQEVNKRVYYGEPKALTFDLETVGIDTLKDPLIDDIDWSTKGYVGKGSEIWQTAANIGIDSADLEAKIYRNPKIGFPLRGRIIEWGFLWWNGGPTVTEGQNALQWPGQEQGVAPKTAAGDSVQNIGFTLPDPRLDGHGNEFWPPDGSKNFCVPMTKETQDQFLSEASEEKYTSTLDLSGTAFDISANDPVEGLVEGYWEDDGGSIVWKDLILPEGNPQWPNTSENPNYPMGPNNEAKPDVTKNIVFTTSVTSREGSEEGRLFNSTVWYRAYAINYFWNNSTKERQAGIGYGEVGRLELKRSVNYAVDMENPVLISSNIGTRSILVRGSLLGNMDGNGDPIIQNYGFCWRKLTKSGTAHQFEKNDLNEWVLKEITYGESDSNFNYPPPTIIDSSMVALGIRAEGEEGAGSLWSDETQLSLKVYDPSNMEVAGGVEGHFGASGEFPGEPPSLIHNGFTQNPPTFASGSRVWKFHYKIGSDGEELEAEGGVKDSKFVGFDASGGKPVSNTYYLIRSWVKGPIDPGTRNEDDGETASGIKYGPIWYISSQEIQTNKKKGWLALTKKLEACLLDDVDIDQYNLTHNSAIVRSRLLTNPDPSKLKHYGFVFMLDDASQNGLPTINDNFVLINNPELVGDFVPRKMQKKISLAPNSWYTVRAFADNSFTSYSDYEKDEQGNDQPVLSSGTEEGAISYSNPISFRSDFCPPPKTNIILVSDVSYVTVKLIGEIVTNFNGLISKHGFCVGTSEFPTINDSKVYDLGFKNDLGYYSFDGGGLEYGTKYYVRSFAYHSGAMSDKQFQYSSNALEFTTLMPPPPNIGLTKQLNTGNGSVEAIFESEILDTSGIELISSFGFCWTREIVPLSGKQWDPSGVPDEPVGNELTIHNAENYSQYTNLPAAFPFSFKTELKNLQPSTVYYIRSYAHINPSAGFGYGEVQKFLTWDEPCDCIPVTTKPIGVLKPNLSSKMLCAQAIKRRGSAIIGTQGVTPNLV